MRRDPYIALSLAICAVVALIVVGFVATLVLCVVDSTEKPLRNAYWPYSVETAVRDK